MARKSLISDPLAKGGPEPPVEASRSALMARIGPKHSVPEMAVRRLVHSLGFRFRLHRRDLPGRPDLVFPAAGKVIFVHGCFWHRHANCARTTNPKTRAAFWEEKFRRNVKRDAENVRDLRNAGWKVLIVWECETRQPSPLQRIIKRFLAPQSGRAKR
jgi:DNA mismatch endonuclease (patch repair protein)